MPREKITPASTSGKSIAVRNREIRQAEMRRKIVEFGCLGKVLANLTKMQTLQTSMKGGPDSNLGEVTSKINALQMTNSGYFKLIHKVLPDLKLTELDLSDEASKVLILNLMGVAADGGDEVG